MHEELIAASRQALFVLEHSYPMQSSTPREHDEAIAALRNALGAAQGLKKAPQEPHATRGAQPDAAKWRDTECRLQLVAAQLQAIHETPQKDHSEKQKEQLKQLREQAVALGYERFSLLSLAAKAP